MIKWLSHTLNQFDGNIWVCRISDDAAVKSLTGLPEAQPLFRCLTQQPHKIDITGISFHTYIGSQTHVHIELMPTQGMQSTVPVITTDEA